MGPAGDKIRLSHGPGKATTLHRSKGNTSSSGWRSCVVRRGGKVFRNHLGQGVDKSNLNHVPARESGTSKDFNITVLVSVSRSFRQGGKRHQALMCFKVLRLLTATIPSVSQAEHRMHPIRWHVKQHWESMDFEDLVTVTGSLLLALEWWTDLVKSVTGKAFPGFNRHYNSHKRRQ